MICRRRFGFFRRRHQDDFAWFHQFQIFAREFFNRRRIGSQCMDFRGERFVFGFDPGVFGFDRIELFRLRVNFEDAFVVEYGKQERGDGENAEYHKSDSIDDASN